MSATVTYKGETLTTVTNDTVTLETAGTWVEDDFTLTDVSAGGNMQAKTNIAPTTSSQTITPDYGYDGLSSVQINAMPSGTAGTPTASKGAVSNHSISVTPSVTNTTGYITGSTINGTAVTVSASELDSGSKSITANGNSQDVVGYASVDVAVPNSYSAGDEGKVVSSGALVSQTAHADVTPTTSDQTIDTTTNNSIKVKGDADLVAGNIKKDVEIFGVTGSYEGGGGGSSPISLLDTVTVSSDTRAVNLDLTPYASYDFIMVYLDATLSSADWLYFVQNGSTPSGGSYTNQQIIRQTGIMYEKMKLVGLPDTWHLLPGSNAIVGNKTATTNVYVYTYAANKTIKAGSKFTIYGGNYADL